MSLITTKLVQVRGSSPNSCLISKLATHFHNTAPTLDSSGHGSGAKRGPQSDNEPCKLYFDTAVVELVAVTGSRGTMC